MAEGGSGGLADAEEGAVGVDDGEFEHAPWFEGERVDAWDAVGGEVGGGEVGEEGFDVGDAEVAHG